MADGLFMDTRRFARPTRVAQPNWVLGRPVLPRLRRPRRREAVEDAYLTAGRPRWDEAPRRRGF